MHIHSETREAEPAHDTTKESCATRPIRPPFGGGASKSQACYATRAPSRRDSPTLFWSNSVAAETASALTSSPWHPPPGLSPRLRPAGIVGRSKDVRLNQGMCSRACWAPCPYERAYIQYPNAIGLPRRAAVTRDPIPAHIEFVGTRELTHRLQCGGRAMNRTLQIGASADPADRAGRGGGRSREMPRESAMDPMAHRLGPWARL